MKKISHSLLISLLFTLLLDVSFNMQIHAETLTVSAIVVSKGNCSFINNAATLAFGTLNPLNPQDISVDTGDQLSFLCRGGGNTPVTYAITVTASEFGTPAAPAMQHEANLFDLPYQLSVNPASGTTSKNIERPLVVTGTVHGDDYKLAPVGIYTGTATLSINP